MGAARDRLSRGCIQVDPWPRRGNGGGERRTQAVGAAAVVTPGAARWDPPPISRQVAQCRVGKWTAGETTMKRTLFCCFYEAQGLSADVAAGLKPALLEWTRVKDGAAK